MNSTPVRYVLLAFGDNVNYHSQLLYCLISIMANHPEGRDFSVAIVTDKDEYYRWLPDSIDVYSVDEQQLQTWRGSYDFFWRIKIEAYILAIKDFDGHSIYLDTDTIVQTKLDDMLEVLDDGKNQMHVREYAFSKPIGSTGRKMKTQGLGKVYGDFTLDEQSEMWNAGVVAISAKNSPMAVLEAALKACDAMSKDEMFPKLIEQFAFSLALKPGELVEAKDWIRHYWGNKGNWNIQITGFFSEVLMKQWSLEQAIDSFHEQDQSLVDVIKETKLEKYRNSIAKRLKL